MFSTPDEPWLCWEPGLDPEFEPEPANFD
jgi:hypothetical protein